MPGHLVETSSAGRATTMAGLASILIGLVYMTPFLGTREQEVGEWGVVSFALGVALLVFSAIVQSRPGGPAKLVGALACLGLALLQVLPITLWLVIGATTDNVPPHGAATRLAFAAGHAAVLLVAVRAMVIILRATHRAGREEPQGP